MDTEFAQFLVSTVNLDTLERITRNLDDELKDSQVVMNEIKGMINTLPAEIEKVKSEQTDNGLRHEDISNFLSASPPKLLMPDMDENTDCVNFENVIATMKCYAEDLKKSLTVSDNTTQDKIALREVEKLDLDQYAMSLDQLCKRISLIKLNKKDEINCCNPELDAKLSVLCEDVNMFTKSKMYDEDPRKRLDVGRILPVFMDINGRRLSSSMIKTKTALSRVNKNMSTTCKSTTALDFDNMINKMIYGINAVTHLLQKKN